MSSAADKRPGMSRKWKATCCVAVPIVFLLGIGAGLVIAWYLIDHLDLQKGVCPPAPTPSQSVTEVCRKAKIDLGFALDGSGSICDNDPTYNKSMELCNNWKKTVKFVENIVDTLTIGPDASRVGLVMFANNAQVKWTLDQYITKSSMLSAVRGLEQQFPSGNTNTQEGLMRLRTEIFNIGRDNTDKVGIVITDGVPTVKLHNTIPEASKTKEAGIKMVCVGVTDEIEEDVLREISSPPQKRDQSYFMSPDFTALGAILDTILVETCTKQLGASP